VPSLFVVGGGSSGGGLSVQSHSVLCPASWENALRNEAWGATKPLSPEGIWCMMFFVCIPPELQQKLSLHSCEAIFLGYPTSVKVYHCQDQ
jgi:hypothetical protein